MRGVVAKRLRRAAYAETIRLRACGQMPNEGMFVKAMRTVKRIWKKDGSSELIRMVTAVHVGYRAVYKSIKRRYKDGQIIVHTVPTPEASGHIETRRTIS